jgi:tetratricopeptide (TPR) repeat protein
MSHTEQFSRADIRRILELPERQLEQWERLEFVLPLKSGEKDFYDFRDLIRLRAAKQLLENGISPQRLRLSLQALTKRLAEVKIPLNELHIVSNGKDVIVETADSHMEPISGQLLMNFRTRELSDRVVRMPDRNAPGLFELALEYDGDPEQREKAAQTYARVLTVEPNHIDAIINVGMMAYEDGDLEKACEYFRRAVEIAPDNAVARFNLGSTLDDQGLLQEARQQLRLATRLDPQHADSHYNLGIVCEKLGANEEAHSHWAIYLKLDSSPEHCKYVRERLGK